MWACVVVCMHAWVCVHTCPLCVPKTTVNRDYCVFCLSIPQPQKLPHSSLPRSSPQITRSFSKESASSPLSGKASLKTCYPLAPHKNRSMMIAVGMVVILEGVAGWEGVGDSLLHWNVLSGSRWWPHRCMHT